MVKNQQQLKTKIQLSTDIWIEDIIHRQQDSGDIMISQLQYRTNFLTDDECKEFIEYYKDNESRSYRGEIRYPPYAEVNLQKKLTRVVDMTEQLEFKHLEEPLDRVRDLVKSVNETDWKFDVDWQSSKEREKSAKIIKYEGDHKGFWARHQNVNWLSNDKHFKIVASIQLSDTTDYEGGNTVYYFGDARDKPTPKESRTRGTLCIYPAFRMSQTYPVLSGNKYVLEFLFEGPCWK